MRHLYSPMDRLFDAASAMTFAYASFTVAIFSFVLVIAWAPSLLIFPMAGALTIPAAVAVVCILGAAFDLNGRLGRDQAVTRFFALCSAAKVGLIHWALLFLCEIAFSAAMPAWALALSAIAASVWLLMFVCWAARRQVPAFRLITGFWF